MILTGQHQRHILLTIEENLDYSEILNLINEEIACLYQDKRVLVGAPSFLQYFMLKSGRLMSARKGCRDQKER